MRQLSDVATIVMGQSPKGDACSYMQNGLPLLNGPTEFGTEHPTPTQWTTDPKRLADKGDLLFCVRGSTTGRMNWADKEYAIGRGLAALSHKKGSNYQPWLRGVIEYQLESLLVAATGSTFPNVSKNQLHELAIPAHEESEQREISAILGALDDKIELNRKTAVTLEEMARALYRSWFVDFDPVHARSQGLPPAHMPPTTASLFPDSFGEDGLPEGWEMGQVEDLFVLQRGFDLPKSQRRDGPYPVYAAGGFHGNHGEFKVKGPSVTTGRSGVIGQVYLVLEDFWPLNTSLWIKEFKKCSPYFAFFFLQTIDLKSLNSGSAVPSLNRNNVHNMQVGMPPQEIVHKFDEFAAPVFGKIQQLNAENQTLATLRDTLLPRLMSGELRVGDARELVKETV